MPRIIAKKATVSAATLSAAVVKPVTPIAPPAKIDATIARIGVVGAEFSLADYLSTNAYSRGCWRAVEHFEPSVLLSAGRKDRQYHPAFAKDTKGLLRVPTLVTNLQDNITDRRATAILALLWYGQGNVQTDGSFTYGGFKIPASKFLSADDMQKYQLDNGAIIAACPEHGVLNGVMPGVVTIISEPNDIGLYYQARMRFTIYARAWIWSAFSAKHQAVLRKEVLARFDKLCPELASKSYDHIAAVSGKATLNPPVRSKDKVPTIGAIKPEPAIIRTNLPQDTPVGPVARTPVVIKASAGSVVVTNKPVISAARVPVVTGPPSKSKVSNQLLPVPTEAPALVQHKPLPAGKVALSIKDAGERLAARVTKSKVQAPVQVVRPIISGADLPKLPKGCALSAEAKALIDATAPGQDRLYAMLGAYNAAIAQHKAK